MSANLGTCAKAFAAGATAAGTALASAQGDGAITTPEWTTIAVAFLVGFLLTWIVPNSASSDQTGAAPKQDPQVVINQPGTAQVNTTPTAPTGLPDEAPLDGLPDPTVGAVA